MKCDVEQKLRYLLVNDQKYQKLLASFLTANLDFNSDVRIDDHLVRLIRNGFEEIGNQSLHNLLQVDAVFHQVIGIVHQVKDKLMADSKNLMLKIVFSKY